MQITFCAFGDLRRYTPEMAERLNVELPALTTVSQALDSVGVPLAEVGLMVINGKLVDEHAELAEGDKLEVFSPIGGG
jgi:sulfur carrier protein ThiS